MRMSKRLDFGVVWINTHIPFVSEMPHGGFKHSGYGKDLSMYGLEDYTRIKHVMSYIGDVSMATVDVLVTGYVEQTETGDSSVHPTVSLVRDGDLVIVVDPGILSDPALLTDALAGHGLGRRPTSPTSS